MHPRPLLLVALLSHWASASKLSETAKAVPLAVDHAGPPESHLEPQTTTATTTATHPDEAAPQDLPPDYGPANELVSEFFGHSRMRPDVYQGILDSLLKGGSASTLELILDFDEMERLAAKGDAPFTYYDHRYLREFRENVRERLYEPIVSYLISDEFMEKARAAGRGDLVDVVEWVLPLPLLKRAVKELDCTRMAEILAWYKDYLTYLVNNDGYPLNVYLFDIDPTFLLGCEEIISRCIEPVVLDEFFKYPYFAWKAANMLHEAVRRRRAEFAEYLVSKLSEEYYAKSNPSLSRMCNLEPAAHMYRTSLQDAFLGACRLGLPQIAAALAKFEAMDVEGGFIEAVLGGHVNVLFVLFQTCGAANIPSQGKLLARLQGLCSHVRSHFSRTYFPYPPVPGHFDSIEAFVQFLKERIRLIENNIASCGGDVRPRRGRGGRPAIQPTDISTDKKMKMHFEAVIRAIGAVSLLRLPGPFLLAVANSYGF